MSNASKAQRQFKRFIGYPLEAALVYALFGFFRVMPVDAASAVGGFLGRNIGGRLGGVKKKVRRNLAAAMPELTRDEQDKIILGMWDNLGRTLAEYAHLDKFGPDRVEVIDGGDVATRYQTGKGFILASGHFANWEILPVTIRKNNIDAQLIYRHANNPYVEKLMQYARAGRGLKFSRKGVAGARSVHGALRDNKVVAMLVDQKHNRGMPIPFFNRPAMTAPAVADLALKYNAPILMGRCERLEGARFRVTTSAPLDVSSGNAEEILTRINAQLEQWIRERPEQWLWLHKRWSD